MLVDVQLLCEDGGRALQRHRLAFLRDWLRGELVLKEDYDAEARRHVRCAWLRAIGHGANGAPDVLPQLRDVTVLFVENWEMVLTGLEMRDDLGRQRTAQTWRVRVVFDVMK